MVGLSAGQDQVFFAVVRSTYEFNVTFLFAGFFSFYRIFYLILVVLYYAI